jgi:hypothetical protein
MLLHCGIGWYSFSQDFQGAFGKAFYQSAGGEVFVIVSSSARFTDR